jgi:hypothetical protein
LSIRSANAADQRLVDVVREALGLGPLYDRSREYKGARHRDLGRFGTTLADPWREAAAAARGRAYVPKDSG